MMSGFSVSSLNFFAVSVSLAHLLFYLTSLSIPGIVMFAASLFFCSFQAKPVSNQFCSVNPFLPSTLIFVCLSASLFLRNRLMFLAQKMHQIQKVEHVCIYVVVSSTRIDCLFDIRSKKKTVSLNNRTHRNEAENQFYLKNHWQRNKPKGSKRQQGKIVNK